MTDASQYREDRGAEPAEGPAQTEDDRKDSLPPGADTKPEFGKTGDVDRTKPYGGSEAPERMEEQPPPDVQES